MRNGIIHQFLLISVTVALSFGLSLRVQAIERIKVRAGVHAKFARIAFDWPRVPKFHARIAEGKLYISFARPFEADLAAIKEHLYNYVGTTEQTADKLQLTLVLLRPVRLRTLELNDVLAIDLIDQAAGRKSAKAPPERRIRIRSGEHTGYTRLVADWPRRVGYSVSRRGDDVVIEFDQLADLDLDSVLRDLPSRVKAVASRREGQSVRLVLKTERSIGFRHFRHGNRIVIDLLDGTKAIRPAAASGAEKQGQQTTPTSRPAAAGTPATPDVVSAGDETPYDVAFNAMINNPTSLDKAFVFAKAATEAKDFEGAISALERMLLLHSGLPRVKLELGVLYFRLGAFAVARRYFADATSGKDVPIEVRQRVDAFMAAIEKRLAPHQFSGSIYSGLRYQTNANAGPVSNQVRVSGFTATLEDQYTEQKDASVFAAGNLEYRYDFGRADRLQWLSTGTAYISRQHRQRQVDLVAATATTGPEIHIPSERFENITVQPYLSADYVALDGRRYSVAGGAGLKGRVSVNEKLSLQSDLSLKHQKYNQTVELPLSADSDALVGHAGLSARYQISPTVMLRAGADYYDYDAKAGYQHHRDVRLTAGISKIFEHSIRWLSGPITVIFDVGRKFIGYEDADSTIDPDIRRKQKEWSANVTVVAPIKENLAIIATVGARDVDASLSNYTYDDQYITIGLSWSF